MALKRNVLIFHAGALGDFVLSWPLAMAAGRLFPQSRVFYVAARQKGDLAERALRLESLDGESGWHSLYSNTPQLPPTAERMLAGAHTVVSFVAEKDSSWERNVRAASGGADVLVLAPHPPTDFAGHHTDYLLQQLSDAYVWQQGVSQMLTSIRQRGLGHVPLPEGPVILHPGSGSPTKCWPLPRFVELASMLRGRGKAVRFILGEVERERMTAGDIERLSELGEVKQAQTLLELWDSLRQASAFVGNDSGPSHLAGILGLPTVAIFGPTDPKRWSPLGPNVHTVQDADLAAITADQVASVLPSN